MVVEDKFIQEERVARQHLVVIKPFVYQWILPSGFIQKTWDGPLYILRVHRS